MPKRILISALFALGCSGGSETEVPVVIDLGSLNNTNNFSDAGNDDVFIPPDGFVVDLRADTNRDGTIDFTDSTDDVGEDEWGPEHGAIFLANIDDDQNTCPINVNDESLAGCYDAVDREINGDKDLEDFARLELKSYNVPDDASATLTISRNGDRVRLFRQTGDRYEVVDGTLELSTSDLSSGVVFFLEGRDVVRDESWDGFVEFQIDGTSAEGDSSDTVEMRIAPLLLQHHLLEPRVAFASELGADGDGAFTRDLEAAVSRAGFGAPLYNIDVPDQWAQDFFEVGTMSMPTVDGLHTIDVFIRSANIVQRGLLREAGRFVYTEMRGENVAGLTEVDWNHDEYWDTLNSFGNAETIPPHDGFPVGRILRGIADGLKGDDRMYGLFEAQKVQDPLYVDTGWLLVGHIDETVSFIKDHNNDSWMLVYNDATMARDMLQRAQSDGFGGSTIHAGRFWINWRNFSEYPADLSIDDLLNNANIMAASAEAVVEVDDQIDIIMTNVGLDESRIIGVPFMHESQSGSSVAYQPGAVNGISLGDGLFASPDMHGPIVDGVDIFADAVETSFAEVGVTIQWVEDWDMFHRLSGEVHCGSNVARIASEAWWVSPRGGAQ